jgi:transglutaminase-like putative cysteine protease
VDEIVAAERSTEGLLARECTLDSPLVGRDPDLASYAEPSFPPGRPLDAAAAELSARIFADFTFDPAFSDVSTPLGEVLAHRRGVCQDFAHLAIGCLRSLGLPARYVSGYLETSPPPGQPKLVGSDASHAWCSVFVPGDGWFDLDPTNDQVPPQRHVTVAWGRDYADVAPVRGVVFGPSTTQQLAVAVDVARVLDSEA